MTLSIEVADRKFSERFPVVLGESCDPPSRKPSFGSQRPSKVCSPASAAMKASDRSSRTVTAVSVDDIWDRQVAFPAVVCFLAYIVYLLDDARSMILEMKERFVFIYFILLDTGL